MLQSFVQSECVCSCIYTLLYMLLRCSVMYIFFIKICTHFLRHLVYIYIYSLLKFVRIF